MLILKVFINESRPLTFVRTPSLRTGNEISKNEENLKPSTDVDIIDKTSAVVKFRPDKEEQKKFADLLGNKKENGFAGQFVVQYDVERDPQGGEVLIRDGYFVHFFSPSELEPIPKHVVFVLDHSGSMAGEKIEQLTEAMKNILSDLNSDDLFHMIRFSEEASVWNITENNFTAVKINNPNYGHLEPQLSEKNLADALEVTPENIDKAKKALEDRNDMGSTNIIAGLEIGLFLVKKTQEKFPGKYQPMVIFLTDGQPNVGVYLTNEITDIVTKLNSEAPVPVPIFSLSFGYGADRDFLKKLSLKNSGFSKHIFEAADASLQLQDFYRKISSPLLSNVNFKYVDGVTDVTETHHPFLFNGSELIIAGKINNEAQEIVSDIDGIGRKGIIRFKPVQEKPISSIERLWAYLTVKQLLKEKETAANVKEVNDKALNLALKYSFVTEVTSLVVVKPNKTETAESQSAEPSHFEAAKLGFAGFSSSFGGGGAAFFAPPSYSIPLPQPIVINNSANVPQWLSDLQVNNQNITTSQGDFLLGKSGDVVTNPTCPKTPSNETGECKIIFDCPEIFPQLTDFNTYLQYFCPLKEYAGVCCPKITSKNG